MPRYYSNSIQASLTRFDISLSFLEQLPRAPDKPDQEFNGLCRVYLNPRHARDLVGMLNRMLTDYEEKFGAMGGEAAGPSGFEVTEN